MDDPDFWIRIYDIRLNKQFSLRIYKAIFYHVGVMNIRFQLFQFVRVFQDLFYLIFVEPLVEHLLEAIIGINQNLPRKELNARVRN